MTGPQTCSHSMYLDIVTYNAWYWLLLVVELVVLMALSQGVPSLDKYFFKWQYKWSEYLFHSRVGQYLPYPTATASSIQPINEILFILRIAYKVDS